MDQEKKRKSHCSISQVFVIFMEGSFMLINVLIPRPETERIIDIALEYYKKINPKPSILDIGSGSGCISITMALEISDSNVLGLDFSSSANNIAENSLKLEAKNVSFDDMDILSNSLTQDLTL